MPSVTPICTFKNSDGINGRPSRTPGWRTRLYTFTPLGATGAWQPYAGGGLGVADLDVKDVPRIPGGDIDSDYNFAYQLIGGVGYKVSPTLTLLGEVRYFGINDQDLENDSCTCRSPYHTIDLLIGATFSF